MRGRDDAASEDMSDVRDRLLEEYGARLKTMAEFEKQLEELETVLERLERGDLALGESMRLFEKGMKLSQSCRAELDQAEGRIQVLMETKGGKMKPVEMEVPEDDEDSLEIEEGDGKE
jgi:exodeoxyribonuclease VII small subunit